LLFLPERLRELTAQSRELLRDFRASVMVRDPSEQPAMMLTPAAAVYRVTEEGLDDSPTSLRSTAKQPSPTGTVTVDLPERVGGGANRRESPGEPSAADRAEEAFAPTGGNPGYSQRSSLKSPTSPNNPQPTSSLRAPAPV
jgi:hypothetical protein